MLEDQRLALEESILELKDIEEQTLAALEAQVAAAKASGPRPSRAPDPGSAERNEQHNEPGRRAHAERGHRGLCPLAFHPGQEG